MRANDSDHTDSGTNGFRVVGEKQESIKRLIGFEKHHFVPPRADDYHNAWVAKIAEEDIHEEIASVHERAKRIQGWRRKDISSTTDHGEGVLETPAWTYRLRIELHPEKHGYVQWRRILETSGPMTEQNGSEWDLIFSSDFSILEIYPREQANVPSLIDRFEERGMAVDYPPDGAICRVALRDPPGNIHVESQLIRVVVDVPTAPGTLVLSVSRLIGNDNDGPRLFLLG